MHNIQSCIFCLHVQLIRLLLELLSGPVWTRRNYLIQKVGMDSDLVKPNPTQPLNY